MGIANPETIMEIADGEVRVANALRDDLLAALFPHGDEPPSELLQTRVKLKLQTVVAGIQAELGAEAALAKNWDILARSGLLREKALIEFALSRMAEEKLQKQLSQSGEASPLAQLPASLLGHENARIAEMAKKLLRAEQVAQEERYLFKRLAPEQLHQLCWRVVAVLQSEASAEPAELHSKAQAMLSAHNADDNPAAVSRKLAFFLGSDWQPELADPRKAGLHLFMAMLSQTLSLPTDQLLRLIAEGGSEPTLLMLKAINVPAADVPAILRALRAPEIGPDTDQLAETYDNLDIIEVRAQIATWAQQAGTAA